MNKLKSFFAYGITMLFDKDDADDANNTDANGGNTDDSNKAGGGGADDKNKPETHTIRVDGEDKVLTREETEKYAQLGFSSTQRYQAASEKEKTAERGIRIEELTKSISKAEKPTEADVRELAGLLEIDPNEFTSYLNEGDSGSKTKEKTSDMDFNAEFQKAIGTTPAEVKAILDYSQQRHINDARKEIGEITDKAVDKDEIIGKMIVGEKKDVRLAEIKNMVAEDVFQKIKDGKPFEAELVAGAVQRARSRLTNIGISENLNQHPVVLGLTPSEGISSVIQADEPIKRINSMEDGGEKNLVARYIQKAVLAARKIK